MDDKQTTEELLGQLIEIDFLWAKAQEIYLLAQSYLTSLDFLGQVAAFALAGTFALLVGRRVFRLVIKLLPPSLEGYGRYTLIGVLGVISQSGFWLLLVWILLSVAAAYELPNQFLKVAANLLGAWVVIRAASRIVKDPFISNALFYVAWGVAALNAVGWLGPVLEQINAFRFSVGESEITGLKVLRGLVSLALLIWAAMGLSAFLSHRMQTIDRLTPTLQILLTKMIQFALIAIAVVFALQIIGIPLTAFAIFGGALGLGVGLGLQRAASNVISGLMLLMDKSIKPGDVVSVGSTFGWVTSLGGRYVGLRTRDGIEHLIPNELFVANGVENWSHTTKAVRLKLPIGVSYGQDPHRAIELCLAAAGAAERVVEHPEPVCLLMGFGDSTLDLELRVWIEDPQNGVSNIKSEVYLNVWDAFQEHGIEIPFPQQDLHVKGPLEVRTAAL